MTTIREVRCFEVSGAAEILPTEERQLQMLDVYPEFATDDGALAGRAQANHEHVVGELRHGRNRPDSIREAQLSIG